MLSFQKHTGTGKGKTVDVSFCSDKGLITVRLTDFNFSVIDEQAHSIFYIDAHNCSLLKRHYNKLHSYKSVSALVKYAKANQIKHNTATPCPCPPEIPLTNDCDVTGLGMDGGILIGSLNKPYKSYPKKQDITYLDALKDNENQLRYDTYSIINGTQLPDNLE